MRKVNIEKEAEPFKKVQKTISKAPQKTSRASLKKPISKPQKTPLEVMIFIMNKSLEEENYDLALNVAYKVAPYLHAKLTESKLEITNLKRPEEMSDEELQIFIGASKEGGA